MTSGSSNNNNTSKKLFPIKSSTLHIIISYHICEDLIKKEKENPFPNILKDSQDCEKAISILN